MVCGPLSETGRVPPGNSIPEAQLNLKEADELDLERFGAGSLLESMSVEE